MIKVIKQLPVAVISLILLAASAALILLVAYLIGNPILNGETRLGGFNLLIGNDSMFALSLVNWFERFFPRMPIWYPLQGMGVSLLYSYPMGTTFLILLLSSMQSGFHFP